MEELLAKRVELYIYEVSIEIESSLYDPFYSWLEEHVEEMLRLPFFLSAEIWGDEEKKNQVICHYRSDSRKKIQEYLDEHSSKMRKDGLERFKDKMSVTRRILEKR